MILKTLRDQLNEPPDNKIRFLLLAMSGLIPYLVLDWSYASTSQHIQNIDDERVLIQNEITTSNAMITQIPVLQENISKLESQIDMKNDENSEMVSHITTCKETNVLSILQQFQDGSGPFAGFTVQTNQTYFDFTESVYLIRLKGTYQTILAGMKQVDQSPCLHHVQLWTLQQDEDYPDLLTGTIQVSVYKQQDTLE